MAVLTDEQLVERHRAASGSPPGDSFLNQLFERHHARVAAWCFRMTGDTDAAADMAQDVFLKAFQHLDSFRGASKFTTWLYSIARNHCMDALKSRAAAPSQTEEDVLDQVEDLRAGEILSGMERRESEQLVRQLMLESLDETELKVMTLHYVDELPLHAVTGVLGLTNPSGAKAHIVSAKRKLARAFERWTDRNQRRKGDGIAGTRAR